MATAKREVSAEPTRTHLIVAPRAARSARAKTPDGEKASGEQKTTMLHVRIDDRLKADATSVLNEIGISLSEALRVFLTRVVSEKAFPFRLEVPNATTQAAMKEGRRLSKLRRFETADELFDELEKGSVR